jgi:type I restriction enzyme, S subunit
MTEGTTKRSKAGWTTVALGDVVRQVKDKVDPNESGLDRYVAGEHMNTDDLRIRRWGEIGDGYLGPAFHMRFKPGHVLYGSRRTYLRKVAVADFEGITANTTYVLEPKDPNVLLPELLPFIMQTKAFNQHSVRESKGSVNPYVNFSDLAWYELALPSIEKQRHLVAALAATEAGLETHGALVATLDRLRQASIDRFTALSGVEAERLGEHCEMQNGRPFPGDEYCEDGVLLLRPGNLAPTGYLEWEASKTKHVPARYQAEAADFLVGRGDVVINLTAQSLEDGFMGRVCIARDGDRCLLNQRIGRFTSFSSRLLPEYLYRTLQSTRFKAHSISMCEGSKIKHLFWQHLDQFPVRLPHVDEQRAVTDTLRDLDQRIADASTRVHQLAAIKMKMLAALAYPHETVAI